MSCSLSKCGEKGGFRKVLYEVEAKTLNMITSEENIGIMVGIQERRHRAFECEYLLPKELVFSIGPVRHHLPLHQIGQLVLNP